MREDRFFVNFKISKRKIEISNKEIFHQLKNVLRKKVGERIILFDGKQKEGIAEIKNYLKNKVEVEILKVRKNEKEPKVFVSLYCSILKKQNFELVVQKTTEIGVKEIVPIICKNTVKLGLNLERLKKIAKEAAEQSGRGTLPEILEPMELEKAIERVRNANLKILFDASGKNFFQLQKEKIKSLAVFVGPEGGWAKEEIKLAKKENFEILNLGKLNLRAETAAIVGSFLGINFFQNGNSID